MMDVRNLLDRIQALLRSSQQDWKQDTAEPVHPGLMDRPEPGGLDRPVPDDLDGLDDVGQTSCYPPSGRLWWPFSRNRN